jgi:hypothetical protein
VVAVNLENPAAGEPAAHAGVPISGRHRLILVNAKKLAGSSR